jgi:hypothetical protein
VSVINRAADLPGHLTGSMQPPRHLVAGGPTLPAAAVDHRTGSLGALVERRQLMQRLLQGPQRPGQRAEHRVELSRVHDRTRRVREATHRQLCLGGIRRRVLERRHLASCFSRSTLKKQVVADCHRDRPRCT